MTITFLPKFLEDLRDADDPRFVRRTIDQILDAQGEFKADGNDHRFHGLENGWIRYVSGGKTAYRLVYIRNGNDIYLYRAGHHSIEDRLQLPKQFGGIEVKAHSPVYEPRRTEEQGGIFLKTSTATMLSKVLTGLFHVGHREIWLVSPYISETLLSPYSPFGRFLDKAIEEGTDIVLVTRLSDTLNTKFLESLETRGIAVFLHPKLHAKLYIFEIEPASLSKYNRSMSSTAIVGSANLTEAGLSLEAPSGNEELCYRIPPSQFNDAKTHAEWLANQSHDLRSVKMKINRRF